MANYIDFPEDVNRYYRGVYRKNNPYADVLSTLTRSYAGANALIGEKTQAAQQFNQVQTQRSVADIHASFERGRQGLSNAGFSESFTRATGRTLESGQKEAVTQTVETGRASTPQGEYLDMSKDPFYQSYIADTQARIESTAGLAKDLFAYLNTSDTLSDTDFAIKQGYMNNGGELTEKGKIALNYYTSQIEIEDDEITDELIGSKGTFKRYVQDKMGDKYDEAMLSHSIDELSKMVGTPLGELKSLTREKRDGIFKDSEARFAKEGTEFKKSGRYRKIKNKNAPDLNTKIALADGSFFTVDEMIKFGLADGMRVRDAKGRMVYYHDGEWYLDTQNRRVDMSLPYDDDREWD